MDNSHAQPDDLLGERINNLEEGDHSEPQNLPPEQQTVDEPEMIDLTEDDDDVLEIIDQDQPIKPDSQSISGVPAIFGVSSKEVTNALSNMLENSNNMIDKEKQQQLDDDDDLFVEEPVQMTEAEKRELRKSNVTELLDWFVLLKPEHITSFVAAGSDYLDNYVAVEPFRNLDECRQIVEDFKTNGSLVELCNKWKLENEELGIVAICIGVLEIGNRLDINFNDFCADSIDDWSLKKCRIFLENTKSGKCPKNSPLKFMQFTATTPALAILLLTIVWLQEHEYPCQFEPVSSTVENQIANFDPCDLSHHIIESSTRFWKLEQGKEHIPEQLSRALDELFHEIEATSVEIADHFEVIAGQQADTLELLKEPITEFKDIDVSKMEFLTREHREILIKSRAETEALKEEIIEVKVAANQVYAKKSELAKKLILKKGEYCLARYFPKDENEFKYAVVLDPVDQTSYKVKFIDTGDETTCDIKDLAMTTFMMHDPMLHNTGEIGLRVAVKETNKNEYCPVDCWYSGTTAGRRNCHKGDFIVFLDNGRDLYVKTPIKPEDKDYHKVAMTGDLTFEEIVEKMDTAKIAVIVAQPLSNGQLEKFYASRFIRSTPRSLWIQKFMSNYPECPLLRMNVGTKYTIQTREKKKVEVMCVSLDRAFAVVRYYPKNDDVGYDCKDYPCVKNHLHKDESLYRGSSRVDGLALKLIVGNNNISYRRKTQLASQFEPTDMERPLPQKNSLLSLVRKPYSRGPTTTVVSEQDNRSTKEIEERKRKQALFKKTVVNTPILPPREEFKYHLQCGPDCLQKMDLDPYHEKFHKNSPVHTPLLCGWRRMKYVLSNGKKRVTYKKEIIYYAPCGKPLKDMNKISKYLRDTRSQLTVDCFSFEHELDTETFVIVEDKFIKNQDISEGQEGIPIPLVNSVDDEAPPPLQYAKRRYNLESTVMTTVTRDFCSGCSCEGDCSNSETCECQKLSRDDFSRLPNHLQYDTETPIPPHYNHRSLTTKVITGLYECNDRCFCNRNSCHNRVVQNNIKYPLQIFKTAQSGWGCRVLTDIPDGAFICIYAGALLTNDLANAKENDDEYFADLDLVDSVEEEKVRDDTETDMGFGDDNDMDYAGEDGDGDVNDGDDKSVLFPIEKVGSSSRVTRQNTRSGDEKKRSESKKSEKQEKEKEEIFKFEKYFDNALFVVDAKVRGNLGRFLNHSCDPNVLVQHVLYDTHDLRLPWVAFFSRKHVKAGEELSWDYRYTLLDGNTVRINCKCGAKNCRQRLL